MAMSTYDPAYLTKLKLRHRGYASSGSVAVRACFVAGASAVVLAAQRLAQP